jgi:hypothetical protein
VKQVMSLSVVMSVKFSRFYKKKGIEKTVARYNTGNVVYRLRETAETRKKKKDFEIYFILFYSIFFYKSLSIRRSFFQNLTFVNILFFKKIVDTVI